MTLIERMKTDACGAKNLRISENQLYPRHPRSKSFLIPH